MPERSFPDLFGGDLLEMSLALLREFEPAEGYYLAFSGGKDSVVLLRLAQEAGVRFDAHYCVTTCDPPELVQFIRRHHPEVVFERPPHGKSIFRRIAEKGFPTRRARWCCDEFKEHGGRNRRVLTGIRDAESSRRKLRGQVEVCLRRATRTFVHPIKHWPTDMVWWFIRDRHLPYCALYDEGFRRLGCVICPFERNVPRSMVRWPKIWAATRRAFDQLHARSARHRELWPTAEAMWQWWIDRDSPYPRPDLEERLFPEEDAHA